ncbi:MAG: nuclear transport factor 2 family protein [Hyphomonadaceae bacterium]|nr:MAG: hypothetical protein FD160_430 [Caulobacteraceae bacterium]MBT9447179.1 nuclear transport factor 2 family protein [Hyphomonadaceae bacterium]TPW08201.1 MAG: hypothetical protein FD124_562 [Alphaproteobacteria bacterium]
MTRTPEEQRNVDLVMEMFRSVLIPMDSTQVDHFISPDYIQHSQLAAPGVAALRDFLDEIRPQHPYATHDIKRVFADGDHVIVHYLIKRWPEDAGMIVCDIFRIEDGMIREHWDVLQDVRTDGPNPHSPV